jgi:hypothetical protein
MLRKTKTYKRKVMKLVGKHIQSMIKTLIIQNQQLNYMIIRQGIIS